MTFSKRKFAILSALLTLSINVACSHYSPAYNGPPAIIAQNTSANNGANNIELSHWWTQFSDPKLTQLIEAAIANNHDLAAARERVSEVRELVGISQIAKGPQGNVNANSGFNYQSENGALPISRLPGINRGQTIFKYGYDASWEIDIFGGVRHNIDASEARLDISNEEINAAQITIAAEIARLYYELRGAQRELAASRAYIASLEQSRNLLIQRQRAGDLSHREIDEITTRKENFETQLTAFKGRARAATIAIATLIGQDSNATNGLLQDNPTSPPLLSLPIGAQSQLLQRRPDIRIAERRLAMRTSETAVADAARYPRFVISAHSGWEAVNLDQLFDTGSTNANIGGLIQWNIFDGGRIEANIRAAQSRQRQSLENYSQSVIAALNDCARAASDYEFALANINARQEAINATNHLISHAQRRFRAGDISRLELLENERARIELESQNIRAQTQAMGAQIALFKAMGGGWGQ